MVSDALDKLSDKLGRDFVVTAELEPPRGPDASGLVRQAETVRAWVDAVNVTDAPMASLRLSAVVSAYRVQQTGLEAIFHLTCRDRNVIALQAELLGAANLGLNTVLTLTGDPPSRGDHPDAQGVYDLDLLGLLRTVRTLNEGRSHGKDLASPTRFRAAAAANPTAADMSVEASKVRAKLEAGASFFQTQPVFSADDVLRFHEALGGAPSVPVLYGVLPLRSAKMAERVGKWCRVPDALKVALAEEGSAAGVRWARDLVRELHDLRGEGVGGVHLYPLGKAELVEAVVRDVVEPARVAEPA